MHVVCPEGYEKVVDRTLEWYCMVS